MQHEVLYNKETNPGAVIRILDAGNEYVGVDLFPYKVKNRNLFYDRDHPTQLHPESQIYDQYWADFEQRCIEGWWVEDKEGTWVFMPPKLFYFINYVTIVSETRTRIKPWLRDIEWIIHSYWLCVEGFSGFEGDTRYTSHFLARKAHEGTLDEIEKERIPDSCYHNGELKEYIDPWTFLTRTYLIDDPRGPLGRPLYSPTKEQKHRPMSGLLEEYNRMNAAILTARGIGKSVQLFQGILMHEFTFSGVRYMEDLQNTGRQLILSTFCGTKPQLQRSLNTIKSFYDNQPGKYRYDSTNDNDYMGAFYKNYQGNFLVGKAFQHILKDSTGNIEHFGSTVQSNVLGPDSATIAAGDRQRIILVEEWGFCLEKGTKVRMYDMSLKSVEDVIIGDKLLNPDGGYNTVLELDRGVSELYKVEQKRGIDYYVTPNHRLYTEHRPRIGGKPDTIKIIQAKDFNEENLGKYGLRTTYGKKTGLLSFEEEYIPKLDPYYLGLWIGDGHVRSTGIFCQKNNEIQEFLEKYAQRLDYNISKLKVHSSDKIHEVCITKKSGKKNKIITQLRDLDIYDRKRIPSCYQRMSEKNRLQLLAGIIDTDGNLSLGSNRKYQRYEIGVSDRKDLVDEICLLARNLGFDVGVTKKWTNKAYGNKKCRWRWKYRIRISSDIWRIPVKVGYKKADKIDAFNAKNSTPIKVSKSHVGEYYGFTLDGNHLFLLEDNTITHNTGDVILEFYDAVKDTLKLFGKQVGSFVGLGTAGSLEKIKGPKKMFEDPAAFNIFGIPNFWENPNKDIGLFISVLYQYRDYEDENGHVNIKAALNKYISNLQEWGQTMDSVQLGSEKMYNPLVPRDMLIPNSRSIMPKKEAQNQLADIDGYELYPKYANAGELIWDKNKRYGVRFEKDMDGYGKVIQETNPNFDKINKQGRFVMFESPADYIPEYTYFVCFDPTKPKDDDGTSLNGVIVYKHFNANGGWLTDGIAAVWAGRMGSLEENYEQVIKIAKYFNATIFVETNTGGFVKWCRDRGHFNILQRDSYDLEKELARNPKRNFHKVGCEMTARKKAYAIKALRDWLNEVRERDEITGVPVKRNINYIFSKKLLNEVIDHTYDGNFDLISAMLLLMILFSQFEDLDPGEDTTGDEWDDGPIKPSPIHDIRVEIRRRQRRLPSKLELL